MRTMRPRLVVLREAAGAVLLGRSAISPASSPALGHKKKAPISALYRSPFHSSLSISRPHCYDWGALSYHCSPVVPISASSSSPLFSKRLYSTEVSRKAFTKSTSSSKLRSRGPGKLRKQGSTTRRSVSVSASSRQSVTSSTEGRSNKKRSARFQKGGVPTRTIVRSQAKLELHTDSRDGSRSGNTQNQTEIRTSRSKETAAVSLSRKGSLAIEKLKRSQEDRKKTTKTKSTTQDKGSQKKGKRVMRLDPKDTTSKRIYEGYPLPGEEVKEDTPAALSGRVQFRQIVPQPKLMQHIEKYMLGRRRPSELQKAGYDMRITPAPLDNIPYSKKGERQPIQEEAFRHKLRFIAAAKSATSLPPVDLPEVAFAGRSNVGKSSLINALTRQWGVARTSDKPGLTQSINFFRLGGRLCLVDLPGYGFAYAAEEKKEAWEEFVKEFVTTRAGLKRVYILVDAKWGLKLKDEELVQLMEKMGTKYQIVLTKSDIVTPVDLGRRATQILEIFKGNKCLMLPMIMVSSKTGEGLEFFRGNVAKLARASLI
ncbi:hypothetical protein GOP47_0017725 [Adiantum capillus-veneris]|uniref:EngB-type G domain-containing protein n=1 Tax=Adiantum capillus-veneris TaxID=13818 RepID=A0A9D4UGD7_ADICA|nr:hypothetical protein GOP47_0017725 [Adiantum capillus-veneris]